MKEFFKMMFASMAGYLLLSLIMFIIFISMMVSLASFSKKIAVELKQNSVLTLKLDQAIPDRTSENPLGDMDFFSMKSNKVMGLDHLLKTIDNAANNDKIKGIFLDLTDIPSGMATIEEVRNALLQFKKSGKFIISYSDDYTQRAYYLATVADKVYLNPQGCVGIKGLAAELMFFKGTLEKLDIQTQIIRHGKFKSAVEPYILDKMSQANREQYQKLLDVLWQQMVDGIATQRKIATEDLNLMADSLKIQLGEDAVKNKLVDKLLYRDEVLTELRAKLGVNEKDDINFISAAKFFKVKGKEKISIGKKKIALVYAIGQIGVGEGDEREIGSDKLSESIRLARNDSSVKAIVLRINSPGGSALASEVIWREVVLAQKVKPVVVSMGEVAASGGYYIACGAGKIYAQPNTLTGSIGVFGVVPNLEKFFKNKLGITFDVVKTNEHSDYITATRAMQPYETKVLTNQVENIYKVFVGHVAEGRKMKPEDVDSIGQGRVWTGLDAKRIGLVDEIGGLQNAIDDAAKKANLTDYKVVVYPKFKDPFTQIFEDLMDESSETQLQKTLGENYIYYEHLKNIKTQKGIQARLPFDMVIY
ncbi:MAG TPA: signal peptide peptidase SppA [Bacteroidales bacterium]|nr:signal peptide peptidase SppA [Bacteroidales bacterium]HPB24986.1 signal peptide peptidase SppA [Bacteroidales bacterium]HPI30238.1 signal peptide peptidase SppA [Bacteroidales bacterium]HQN15646.1 signal peptide peptidase SppA [Bacteroidales bacterium]HQP15743.1 signal peptide peptidase SppA [Bacteroidales bacterium]